MPDNPAFDCVFKPKQNLYFEAHPEKTKPFSLRIEPHLSAAELPAYKQTNKHVYLQLEVSVGSPSVPLPRLSQAFTSFRIPEPIPLFFARLLSPAELSTPAVLSLTLVIIIIIILFV